MRALISVVVLLMASSVYAGSPGVAYDAPPAAGGGGFVGTADADLDMGAYCLTTTSGTTFCDGGADGDIILANGAKTQGVKFDTSTTDGWLYLTDESDGALILRASTFSTTDNSSMNATSMRLYSAGEANHYNAYAGGDLNFYSLNSSGTNASGNVDVFTGAQTNVGDYESGAVVIDTGDTTTDGDTGDVTIRTGAAGAGAADAGDIFLQVNGTTTVVKVAGATNQVTFSGQTIHTMNTVTCATGTDDFDVDWNDGNIAFFDMEDCDQDANDVNAPTNPVNGAAYTIIIEQSTAGTEDLTWNATFLFPGGTDPVLTQTNNARDVISCLYGDSIYHCSFSQDYQ